jgi:deazaflavin-dependent oxidoreductase (nitroreductase family)
MTVCVRAVDRTISSTGLDGEGVAYATATEPGRWKETPMSHAMNEGSPQHRSLLGLRRKPGRLALAVFRLPVGAYRHDAGWVLGRTFLEFTHTGRRTGQSHDAVVMVLQFDDATREAVICAAWGAEADWFRNLQAGPAVKVQHGRDSYVPEHRFLSDDEAFVIAVGFRRDHPHRLRLLSAVLGWGNLADDDAVRRFVRGHPFVAFRPAVVVATR